MGYYGLFLGLKYKNTQNLVQRLDDEDYSDSETITLKMPLTVPYYSDTEFERVNGEIEYQGEFYRLVKQKFEKDTLHIVCIRDHKSKEIKLALHDYVKTFTDQPGSTSHFKVFSGFIKDYLSEEFKLGSSATGWKYKLSFNLKEDSILLHSVTILSPPPEA
jgi:hypothetical protein